MLFKGKNREDLENINNIVSLHSQTEALGLQDKLGKQNFHEVMKKVFEPFTKTIKDVPKDVAETMSEISEENDKAQAILNKKLSNILNDRGIIANYSLSPLSKMTNSAHTRQLKVLKYLDSNRVIILLINKRKPITVYDFLLTFPDTDKKFELDGELLKTITNINYNADLAKLSDRKITFEFAKELYFDEKALGNKNTKIKSLIRLPDLPTINAGSLKEKYFGKPKSQNEKESTTR